MIRELEDKTIEMIHSEEQKEKGMKKNAQNLRYLWDTINCIIIHIIGSPEEETKKNQNI
jgi:hypothetical protein